MDAGVLLLILYVPGFIAIAYIYARRTGYNLWDEWRVSYENVRYRQSGNFWTKHWRLLLWLGGYAALVYIGLWILSARV